MSVPLRFRDLPTELRNRVYHYMSNSGSACLDTQTRLPILAKNVASLLRAYDRSIIRYATEVHTYVNDDGYYVNRYSDAALRFALDGHLVKWSSDSSGASQRGMVHVVFDSLRGSEAVSRQQALEIAAGSDEWKLHNIKVAKKMATTINRILNSHGPHSPPHIIGRELLTLIYLLKGIHGIKLNGFEKGLGKRMD